MKRGIVLFVLISILLVSSVSALDACIELTSDGEYCVYTDEENYGSGSMAYTSCEQTSYCQMGCCYGSEEGRCFSNTAKAACEAQEDHVWSDDETCAIDQCTQGCCVLADQAFFVTEVRCKQEASSFEDVTMVFDESINTESACLASVKDQDFGCCVVGDSCSFTTYESCNADEVLGGVNFTQDGFHNGMLCSNDLLACDCAKQQTTGCYQGKLYWYDSCGNRENVYSEDDRTSYNGGYMIDDDSVCTVEDPSGPGWDGDDSCGNCDYATGTVCGADDNGIMDVGDSTCVDVNCYDTYEDDDSFMSGGDKDNGESWCVYDGPVGYGLDYVGSRHYRHVCINGVEIVEECADYREEMCIHGVLTEDVLDNYEALNLDSGDYVEAGCRDNRGDTCSSCNDDAEYTTIEKMYDCCTNEDTHDCFWLNEDGLSEGDYALLDEDYEEVEDDDLDGTINEGFCAAQVPPGSKFWDGQGDTCAAASTECTVTYRAGGLTGGAVWEKLGKDAKAKNYDIVSEVPEGCASWEWLQDQNSYCRALGDCGAYYNILGPSGGDDGVSYDGFVSTMFDDEFFVPISEFPDKDEMDLDKDLEVFYGDNEFSKKWSFDNPKFWRNPAVVIAGASMLGAGIAQMSGCEGQKEMDALGAAADTIIKQKEDAAKTCGDDDGCKGNDIGTHCDPSSKKCVECVDASHCAANTDGKTECTENVCVDPGADPAVVASVDPSVSIPSFAVADPCTINYGVDGYSCQEYDPLLHDPNYKQICGSEDCCKSGFSCVKEKASASVSADCPGWDYYDVRGNVKFYIKCQSPYFQLCQDGVGIIMGDDVEGDACFVCSDSDDCVGQQGYLGYTSSDFLSCQGGLCLKTGNEACPTDYKCNVDSGQGKCVTPSLVPKEYVIADVSGADQVCASLAPAPAQPSYAVADPGQLIASATQGAQNFGSGGMLGCFGEGIGGAWFGWQSLAGLKDTQGAGSLWGLGSQAIGMVGGSGPGSLTDAQFNALTKTGQASYLKSLGQAKKGYTASGTLGVVGVAFAAFLAVEYGMANETAVTYSVECNTWVPPEGGDKCEECNDGNRPCSEYRCRSLGAACTLLNEGTGNETCVSTAVNDVNSPVIDYIEEYFEEDWTLSDKTTDDEGNKGFEIETLIPAFTPVYVGVNTDEPALCKYSLEPGVEFDDMNSNFGSGVYAYNHTVMFSLGDEITSEEVTALTEGIFTIYVRCTDYNGNENERDYWIRFGVDTTPDLTPPEVVFTSIANNAYMPYGVNETEFELYLSEPSSCRWALNDTGYEFMDNDMDCQTSGFEQSSFYYGTYQCKDDLYGLNYDTINEYYFRCIDGSSNINEESFELTLKATEDPLEIVSVEPEGEIYNNTLTVRLETDGGAYDGSATCGYSTTEVDHYQMIAFFETNDTDHAQEFTLVEGEYEYYFSCMDAAGNVDTNYTSFNIDVDVSGPQIVSFYISSVYNSLYMTTDEEADCEYASEEFTFGEGAEMVDDGVEHEAGLDRFVYYIICEDNYANQGSYVIDTSLWY